MVNEPDEPAIWIPPRPAPRWTLRIVGALVVVAALIAGGMKAHDAFFVQCADGLRKRGPSQECIGVTDGSYTFGGLDDGVSEVIDKIHGANQDAEDSEQTVVQIAYVEPFTLGDGDDRGRQSLRQGLRGAYLAQKKLNDRSGNGNNPKVKLLLANPGQDSKQWGPVVDQLIEMRDDDPPLVGVTGLGQSLMNTKHIVDGLSRQKVPMVGSTVTADKLSEDAGHFFRIVQPNSYQAKVMVEYLRGEQRDIEPVHLIYDDNKNDIYGNSLVKAFREEADNKKLDLESVRSDFTSREGSAADTMPKVVSSICSGQDGSDIDVFFAGRGRDLRKFLDAAVEEDCRMNVYAGDDALGVFYDQGEEDSEFRKKWRRNQNDPRRADVRVRYTALTHPQVASDVYDRAKVPDRIEDLKNLAGGDFKKPLQLQNGQVMIGYDATWTLGEAARQAYSEKDADVNASSVKGVLQGMRGTSGLDGVSGPISFGEDGNPTHRPLPLVELRPWAKENERYRACGLLQEEAYELNGDCAD